MLCFWSYINSNVPERCIKSAFPFSPINLTDLANLDEIELCVDEPGEMFVDYPEEVIQLTELLEGVSVDGPPLVTASQWIGKRPKSAIVPC